MGWFGIWSSPSVRHSGLTDIVDDERETHNQVFQDGEVAVPEEHKSKFSHELLAGGVAWEGTRLLEQHLRKEGSSIPFCRTTVVFAYDLVCSQAARSIIPRLWLSVPASLAASSTRSPRAGV